MHDTQQTTAPAPITPETTEAFEMTGITSPYIEQLVAEQIARDQAEATAAQERAEANERTACEQQASAFRALIEGWLDERQRADLQVRVYTPGTLQEQPQARLTYHGEWAIRPCYEHFELLAPDNCSGAKLSKLDTADQAWNKMLAGFAAYDQRIASDIKRQAENKAAYAQRQAEQEAAVTTARAEHEACLAEIEATRKVAEANQWQWPEGRCIAVYRWTWQSGHTEEGEAITSHGWSRPTDLLHPLHLQETRHQSERRIHLRDKVHLPVAEEHRFASTAELHDELTQITFLEVGGIAWIYSRDLEERVYAHQAGESMRTPLAPVPVAWIRELVESRFSSTHPHPFDGEIPF